MWVVKIRLVLVFTFAISRQRLLVRLSPIRIYHKQYLDDAALISEVGAFKRLAVNLRMADPLMNRWELHGRFGSSTEMTFFEWDVR
jgi:hypothetical protein